MNSRSLVTVLMVAKVDSARGGRHEWKSRSYCAGMVAYCTSQVTKKGHKESRCTRSKS